MRPDRRYLRRSAGRNNFCTCFNANKIETITDTDLLKETGSRHSDGRMVYIDLSYRLGGVNAGGRRTPIRTAARPAQQAGQV